MVYLLDCLFFNSASNAVLSRINAQCRSISVAINRPVLLTCRATFHATVATYIAPGPRVTQYRAVVGRATVVAGAVLGAPHGRISTSTFLPIVAKKIDNILLNVICIAEILVSVFQLFLCTMIDSVKVT